MRAGGATLYDFKRVSPNLGSDLSEGRGCFCESLEWVAIVEKENTKTESGVRTPRGIALEV